MTEWWRDIPTIDQECGFAKKLAYTIQVGETAYCRNSNCSAAFQNIDGKFERIEGECRFKIITGRIAEIKRILTHFSNLDSLKKEELDMQLRDLANELGDFDFPK